MSSITWNNDQLIQQAGKQTAELGYVRQDSSSGKFVLWLKDTCGILDLNGGYIRGDEFASMAVAKEEAAVSPSVFIMHYIWMRRSIKTQVINTVEEHWREISAELEEGASKKDVTDQISKHFDKISLQKIKEWCKIALNVVEIAEKVRQLIANLFP